jgi:hypothetical protein
MKLDLIKALYPVSVVLPNVWLFNYLIAGVVFVRANGRLPRPPEAANAEINDFIFKRMISNNWSLLQQFCVDKQFAKLLAAHAANVKIPRTIAVFSLQKPARLENFMAWLKPYIGSRLIAKPTHGSGKVLFLDRSVTDDDVADFFADSRRSFFYALRETQYKTLERKIILEENISNRDHINDYKFFCVKGQVLYCQIDVDRFVNHKRALFRLPDFTIIPVKTKFLELADHIQKPARLEAMMQIASELSKELDFVRIDLYDVEDGVYFGEYTFSPGAACDNFSNTEFANEFLRTVRTLLRSRSQGER